METRMLKIINNSTRIKIIIRFYYGVAWLKEKIGGLDLSLTVKSLGRIKNI